MTVNNDLTPIYLGTPLKAGEYTLIPQILTLDGEANVLIQADDGEELVVPARFLDALGSRASSARATIANETDMLRREFHGDVIQYGLEKIGNNSHQFNYMLTGSTYADDGVPVLMWNRDRNGEHDRTGWKIYLSGTKEAYIGFARWDDKQALLNLVEQMKDVEGMFTISGIMFPETTSKLSSRMAAARMRTARELPGIDLKKARQILTDAGLASTGSGNRYHAARMRLLTLASGGKQVPIAVAVVGPMPTSAELKMTKEEEDLPWQERQELIRQRQMALRKPWQDKANKAFEDAGWRLVNLPDPHGSWSGTVPATWATRIDADTWSTIQAAATVAAGELQMNRGGVL